jgi:heme/copper-type cytochrome/quinol oxidase subunit 2
LTEETQQTMETRKAPHRHAYDGGMKPLSGFVFAYKLVAGFYVLGELLLFASSVFFWKFEEALYYGSEAQRQIISYALFGAFGIYSISFLVCAYFVCRFTYRANRNLYTASPEGMTYHPGWAIGTHFIPVANLFVPGQAMSEIYHQSHKGVGETAKDPSPVSSWWFFWLVTLVASQVSGQVPEYNFFTTVLDAMSCGSGIIAAIILFRIMTRIELKQRQLALGDSSVFD